MVKEVIIMTSLTILGIVKATAIAAAVLFIAYELGSSMASIEE